MYQLLHAKRPLTDVVICTNAFGMGLDLPNVRLVVHWQHPASVEDYLQEFGRAGRDGSPSVAVLFTGTEDAGLLRFMVEQTVRNADLDPAEKSLALQARNASIAQMRDRATARHVCFREAIIQYFGEEQWLRRKSLAVSIVEWLFSRSTQIVSAQGCCDKCDHVQADNVLDWTARLWGLGGSKPKGRLGGSLTWVRVQSRRLAALARTDTRRPPSARDLHASD